MYASCAAVLVSGRTRVRRSDSLCPSRCRERGLSDAAEARSCAREKLDETLGCLRRHGVTAAGRLGSADPVAAIAEALADFPADEILIFTGPDEDSWWLHKETLERAHARFQPPIAQVVLNPPRALAEVA